MIRSLRHVLQAGALKAVVAHCHQRSRGHREDILEMGRGLGRTIWTLFPQLRRGVITALERSLGADDPEGLALRFFEDQLGINAVDSIISWQDFDVAPFPGPVSIVGDAPVREALDSGRGVVLVSGHYGNWELLSQWLAHKGFPISSVQRLHRNEHLHRDMTRWRGANGTHLVDFHRRRPESFRECVEVLRRGEILGLMVDVAPKARSLEVDFLGKRYDVPRGPVLMATMTGSQIVPAFAEREGSGYRICFGDLIDPPAKGANRDAETLELTRHLAKILEDRIRSRPDHWTWVLDAWRRRPFSGPSSRR